MVKQCYVINCKTGRKSAQEKFSLFKAPNDEHLLELWRRSVPQKERILMSSDRICEKHFEKCMVIPRFVPSPIGGFYEDRIRPKLTPNAVPTIFYDIDENDPRIQKYAVTTKSLSMTETPVRERHLTAMNSRPELILLAIEEVSEIDSIPICFKCLIGDCCTHSFRIK